jgi:molybdopterin-synthase adenylyltransferase
MELRVAASDLEAIRRRLFVSAPDEGAAFLSVEPSSERLVLRSYRVFERSEVEDGGFGELSLTEGAQIDGLAAIKRGGHGLVEAHTHPGADGQVRFSSFDSEQLPRFARYVRNKLPGRVFGALVFGSDSFEGRVWSDEGSEEALTLRAVGERRQIPSWAAGTIHGTQISDQFDRQIRALGPDGQRAISELRVGVVGLGGTGSQIVQQLAHIGVRELLIVDDDRVEASNLPRLAGAAWWDVLFRRRKSAIARRQARRVRRGLRVRTAGNLRSLEALQGLRDVDLMVGCVDNDGARLVLAELAAAHLIPFLDIGVGVEREDLTPTIGGRLAFYIPGGACLACGDELDFGEAAEDMESAEQRSIRIARGYARDRAVEPALMPLNTVLVGLAMTEVLAYVTGIRGVVPFSRYDLLSNRVICQNVEVDDECVVCGSARGMGDRQEIERFAIDR